MQMAHSGHNMAVVLTMQSAMSRNSIHVVWTVGHSARGEEEFIDLLARYRIQAVADVRRFPGSRRQPQFAREALAKSLAQHGIGYLWIPKLGGRRKPRPDSPNTAWRNESFRGYADHLSTTEFAEGYEELLGLASGRRTALMCAEVLWWRCHRALISDVLACSGIEVIHILDATHSSEHPYTSAARIRDGKLDYGSEPTMDCMAAPPRNDPAPADRQDEHLEDLIDEAGAESFPASDPPAITPARNRGPVAPKADDREREPDGSADR
jgi:hypothetical protein